jgi:ABC-type nickel/cobalt efflux system permease component RcnA
MVLLFSLYMGSPLLGVAALLFIALGQGLVVSLAAYLAWFGREGLFLKLKERERTVAMVSGYLEIASYALILGFSIYMVWPFLLSLA